MLLVCNGESHVCVYAARGMTARFTTTVKLVLQADQAACVQVWYGMVWYGRGTGDVLPFPHCIALYLWFFFFRTQACTH